MAVHRDQIIFGVFKGMGDLLWASPVIVAELERGVEVHLLLFPNPALASLCTLIDFGPNRENLHMHALPSSMVSGIRLLAELRSLSPSLVWISPHAPAADSSWKIPLGLRLMQMLFWPRAQLAGATTERLSGLFQQPLAVDRTSPLAQREWSAYRLLRSSLSYPELPLLAPRPHFLPEITERRDGPPAFDLVIHPGASAKNRIWPADMYPALLRALPAEWRIAILGQPADIETLKSVLPVGRHIEYILITGTLLEALETLASAAILLVMDSGMMHFAEVLGVPTLAIFGQQDPVNVIAAHGSVEPFYRRTVPCQPCGRSTCSQPEVYCLTNLDPLEVAQSLIDRWTATQTAPELMQIQPAPV